MIKSNLSYYKTFENKPIYKKKKKKKKSHNSTTVKAKVNISLIVVVVEIDFSEQYCTEGKKIKEYI